MRELGHLTGQQVTNLMHCQLWEGQELSLCMMQPKPQASQIPFWGQCVEGAPGMSFAARGIFAT